MAEAEAVAEAVAGAGSSTVPSLGFALYVAVLALVAYSNMAVLAIVAYSDVRKCPCWLCDFLCS